MDDINKKSFSGLVETFVRTHRDCNYMDAIISVCESNEIDLGTVRNLSQRRL